MHLLHPFNDIADGLQATQGGAPNASMPDMAGNGNAEEITDEAGNLPALQPQLDDIKAVNATSIADVTSCNAWSCVCTTPGVTPHPTHCQAYIECVANGTGIMQLCVAGALQFKCFC